MDLVGCCPVPGEVVVQVPSTSGQFVYVEGPRSVSVQHLVIRVTDPLGRPVALEPYGSDLRYEHAGQVGRALATFRPPQAGRYAVSATGSLPGGSRIAMGQSIAKTVIPDLVEIIALLLVTVGGGVLMVVVTVVRRSSARRYPLGAATALPLR